jgi:hypothetical protein
MRIGQPPRVEVWLGGPLDSIQGKKWPVARNGAPLSGAGVDDRCQLVIHFANNSSYKTDARQVFLREKERKISGVTVVRFNDRPMKYEEAERVAEEILLSIPGADIDDPRIQQSFDKWRQGEPLNTRYHMLYNEMHGFSAFLEITPRMPPTRDNPSIIGTNNWYIVIEFALYHESENNKAGENERLP